MSTSVNCVLISAVSLALVVAGPAVAQTGACCLGTGGCELVDSEVDCTSLGGTFLGDGTACIPNCCPQPVDDSGDACADATVLALNVPDYVTISGDNYDASGPDCASLDPDPLEWIAFSIPEEAIVTIDYCCTNPVQLPFYTVLFDECPCGVWLGAEQYEFGMNGPAGCEDGNPSARWRLPGGTYFYPVYSDSDSSVSGPYTIHVAVEELPPEVFESFEEGFGPWRAQGHIHDGLPFDYSVTRCQEEASDGSWSLNFTADGSYDDGTVWIVRDLELPAGEWNIDLEFYIFQIGGGDINLFPAVAFIGTFEPQVEGDFALVGDIEGPGWAPYTYAQTLTLMEPATAWVALGFTITWETTRTYYFDEVTITGIPVQCGNGNCFGGESPCNCVEDCGVPDQQEIPGESCADGVDNDCDGLTDCADDDCGNDSTCRPIPAVSSWGVVVLALLVMAAGTVLFRRRQFTCS